MKKLLLIISLIFIIWSWGCQNVDVVNPQINYKKYIVVRAELKAFRKFQGVTFTQTLPLNEKYDIKKAELKNVAAYLKINNVRIIPLHYVSDGVYQPIDTITIKQNTTYELFAEVNGKTIYCKTKVPESPQINSASLTGNYITASVNSNPGEVYGAVWQISDPGTKNVFDQASDFQEIIGNKSTNPHEPVLVQTTELPEKYRSSNYAQTRFVKVYAFDTAYLKYFDSRNNNQPVDNAFIQGGDQVFWNVQGNDVIGLFIGSAEGGIVRAE